MRDILAGHFHKLLVIYYFYILINHRARHGKVTALLRRCARP